MYCLQFYIALYVIICVKSDLTEEVGWYKVSQSMLLDLIQGVEWRKRGKLLFPLMSNIEEIVPPAYSILSVSGLGSTGLKSGNNL